MSEALYNAYCRLIEPVNDAIGADRLSRSPREVRHEPRRCSFRQMSMTQQASVLGAVSPNTFTMRLQSRLQIKTGWRVSIMLDGEDEWKEFDIKGVRKGLCMNLQLEGVQ